MKLRIGFIVLSLVLPACASQDDLHIDVRVVREDPTDLPLAGLDATARARHDRGDALFEKVFRESSGLGPLYIRAACAACHADDARGPGAVERMVIVGEDGVTPSDDQSLLPFGSVVRPQLAAGATQGILPPRGLAGLRLSRRVGPPTFGRGWIEAVDDAEILAQERAQAATGRVSGRANRLESGALGRFGVKARLATLEDFTADAFRGDMGLTSPTRPDEATNPDGLTDDAHPGVDLAPETIADVAFYVRTVAMPRREGLTDAGRALFTSVGCADCHTPSLRTRSDYPLAALADARAEIYSDLLLHDLGAALADGIVESSASGREWRTAPLIGLRHFRTYLHDGRASTLEEAVAAHGAEDSEARASARAFESLAPIERDALLDFLGRL